MLIDTVTHMHTHSFYIHTYIQTNVFGCQPTHTVSDRCFLNNTSTSAWMEALKERSNRHVDGTL